MRLLAWIGQRAQWVLALGVIGALVVPGPGGWLVPALPWLVALLFGLAMARIDLGAVARRAVGPHRLVRTLGLLVALMGVTPVLFWAGGTAAGLDEGHVRALVLTGAGPPLGSAAAFCLILGFDAALALEVTVIGAALAPVSMPLLARALLGGESALDAPAMALRLGTLIGAAALGAVLVRRAIGPGWIERNRLSFDGLASLILVIFLLPLFHGLADAILRQPEFALITFALAVAANLGVQMLVLPLWHRHAPLPGAGAIAVIWGNRNAALSLAAVPPDPVLLLYVALYQFPMYFTPLVLRGWSRWVAAGR